MTVRGKPIAVPDFTLLQMLQATATRLPKQRATVFMGHELTYGELFAAVTAMMTRLQEAGLRPGDRVGLMLPNCPQYVIAYYAVTGLGAVVVQINPQCALAELEFVVQDAAIRMLVVYAPLVPLVRQVQQTVPLELVIGVRWPATVSTQPGDAQAVSGPGGTGAAAPASSPGTATPATANGGANGAPNDGAAAFGAGRPLPPAQAPDVWMDEWLSANPSTLPAVSVSSDPDAVAVIQYTGGTTGTPKGAMLSHRNLVANVVQTLASLPDGGVDEQDMAVCVLPFYHVYAMTVCMNAAVLTGMTMLLVPRFQPAELLELFAHYRPTYFAGVPTMYVALAHELQARGGDLSSLRICVSGGAPMPVEVLRGFEAVSGATVLEGYGLSEASPVTHFSRDAQSRKVGSIGRPVPGTEVKVVRLDDPSQEAPPGEIGELAVRGPQVMLGYWNRPQETADVLRDGWLLTGDIARIDEDGYTYIVDRKKDLIIASGFNVYPREVEEVLYQHPAVAEAAVVGAPDPYRGETVKAFVVLKPGHTVTGPELQAWCRQRLSAYKVPRLIEFRAELPKTPVGKILRRALRGS